MRKSCHAPSYGQQVTLSRKGRQPVRGLDRAGMGSAPPDGGMAVQRAWGQLSLLWEKQTEGGKGPRPGKPGHKAPLAAV